MYRSGSAALSSLAISAPPRSRSSSMCLAADGVASPDINWRAALSSRRSPTSHTRPVGGRVNRDLLWATLNTHAESVRYIDLYASRWPLRRPPYGDGPVRSTRHRQNKHICDFARALTACAEGPEEIVSSLDATPGRHLCTLSTRESCRYVIVRWAMATAPSHTVH